MFSRTYFPSLCLHPCPHMPIYSDLSSAFLHIPVTPDLFDLPLPTVSSPPTQHPSSPLPDTNTSISLNLAPPPYSPVDIPPDYFSTDHWLLIEIFHSLFFFPASHPFLLHSVFTTTPLSFDSTLSCSIAFPPQYEPRILPAPEPSFANSSHPQPYPIVCHCEQQRAGRFTRVGHQSC